MSLELLKSQRREKLERWRALGCAPYAYSYQPTHHAADLLARGDAVSETPGEPVRIAGRIMTLRGHGKAGFGHVLDGSGRIQVYFRADQLGDHFARYELLDVGDWVGIEGPLFRTRTGEITVRADRIELLAKAIRPMPEKWHGLRDPETRFRQRYADLFMNLDVREVFRRRARITSAIRTFLEKETHDPEVGELVVLLHKSKELIRRALPDCDDLGRTIEAVRRNALLRCEHEMLAKEIDGKLAVDLEKQNAEFEKQIKELLRRKLEERVK